MRIHEIQRKDTPEDDWVHDLWVFKGMRETEKELDRRMLQVQSYCWRIIPYSRKDYDIKIVLPRI